MQLGHRRGSVDVALLREDGSPLAHHDVIVEQTRHAFGFGNIGFELVPHANGEDDRSDLAAAWLALFDTATLPFY